MITLALPAADKGRLIIKPWKKKEEEDGSEWGDPLLEANDVPLEDRPTYHQR